MKKNILVISVLLLASSAIPAKSFFLDFDNIIEKHFQKKHPVTVNIVNAENAPVEITAASIKDKGSGRFKNLTGVYQSFTTKVTNNSDDKVLSYQVAWTLKHPFENFIYQKVTANSIETLDIGQSQELSFKRDKHFRDDAYYYVEISKVEFVSGKVWEAPETDFSQDRWEKVQKEINTDSKTIETEIKSPIDNSIDSDNGKEIE